MDILIENAELKDHCRIGSLEMYKYFGVSEEIDHCRIGSLETGQQAP